MRVECTNMSDNTCEPTPSDTPGKSRMWRGVKRVSGIGMVTEVLLYHGDGDG